MKLNGEENEEKITATGNGFKILELMSELSSYGLFTAASQIGVTDDIYSETELE